MSDGYKHPKWQKKRLRILERDGWKCVACLDGSSTLHVHHKRYSGRPWDVTDDDLQTLCERCHSMLGQHPKAGVWWERSGFHAAVVVAWCPACGLREWKDKGTYDICKGCGFRTSIYGDTGYSLIGGSQNDQALYVPTLLPAWDREVVIFILREYEGAEKVISELDPEDLHSLAGKVVLQAAQRLVSRGSPIRMAELLRDLPEFVHKRVISVYSDAERYGHLPLEPSEHITHIKEAIKRRASNRAALASAEAIKTSRLDCQSEAELLERLVAQRRAAQGMNRKERAINAK